MLYKILGASYAMQRLVYYPDSCDDNIQEHVCNPCGDGEGARVRRLAFIRSDFVFADPTDAAEWIAGIDSGDIKIIPETNGSFDGGTAVKTPGFGDNPETIVGKQYKLEVRDPDYADNALFYDQLMKSRNWKVAFGTETLMHFSDKTVTIDPKNAVEDNKDSLMNWTLEISWSQRGLLVPYTMPEEVFNCFQQV